MQRRVLLDSNLLLLLLIGSFEPALLTRFKRVSQFSSGDFDLLLTFVGPQLIVTTPHVLAEVSNLANSLPEYERHAWLDHFRFFAAGFEEIRTPFVSISEHSTFRLFGLTDAALADLATDTLLVTEDGRLRAHLHRNGVTAISLSDVRSSQANLA